MLTTPLLLATLTTLLTSSLTKADPAYPRGTGGTCGNDLGDCTSAHVKWGHPSPYVPNPSSTISPTDMQNLFTDYLRRQSTAPKDEVFSSTYMTLPSILEGSIFSEPPSLIFLYQVNPTPGVNVNLTRGDVMTLASYLAPSTEFNQSFSGTIWTKDGGTRIGSYSVNSNN